MEKERIAILAIFSVLIASGFIFYLLVYHQAQIQGNAISGNNTNNGTVTDSQGCLIHQGFSWNETEQACVHEWFPVNQTSRYQNNSVSGNKIQNVSSSNETLNWTIHANVTIIENSSFINNTISQQ